MTYTPDGILLRPDAEFAKAKRHPDGWMVFQSPVQPGVGAVDPVEAVEHARAQRRRHIMCEE